MASSSGSGNYITHHLTSWCVGCGSEDQPSGLVAFGAYFMDTIIIGIVCAALIGLVALYVRKNISSGEPGRLQMALESGVEYINAQVSQSFRGRNEFVGALAMAIFLWISVMNLADLLPIDLVPGMASAVGHLFGADNVFFRIVPTAALDTPFAMGISVFVLIIIFNLRDKGPLGYVKSYWVHPYGKFAGPANLASNLIEELAKPVSLSLRLFGTMFAGELIFTLLGMLTLASLDPVKGTVAIWGPMHFIGGFAWSVFHVLVVFLQAFIFSILTIVYLGMTQQGEK